MKSLVICLLAPLVALGLSSCGNEEQQATADPGPVPVQVAAPVQAPFQANSTYTGRLAAVESVELRAQVSGYLSSIEFEAGTVVQEGDTLFQIDPRPYEAAVASAEAQVSQAQATLDLAEIQSERARQLVDRNAVARQEFDQREADLLGARAQLQAAEAKLAQARLDLEFTTIKAPVTGRISAETITEGNLVQGGAAGEPLALLTSIEAIYVSFDIPERDILRHPKVAEGGIDQAPPLSIVFDETPDRRWSARVDYVANEVDAGSGTLRIRGVIDAADGLVPGMFCRVEVPEGPERKVLLVADQAVLRDQGQPFVYVIEDGQIAFRPVQTGPAVAGRRVVESGLGPNDQVIVAGIMRLRPGIAVTPQEVAMPSLEDSAAADEAESSPENPADSEDIEGSESAEDVENTETTASLPADEEV